MDSGDDTRVVDDHEHCVACYNINCSSEDVACPVQDCDNQCGARFHQCKASEHLALCPRAVVACVNSQHGCPFSFDRRKQAGHLQHCPASVVSCSHLWFRRNRKEREEGELVSDPPVPTSQLDFSLAYRDQQQVGGAAVLDDCSVDARPSQRVRSGADIVPRSQSLETLKSACFSPASVRKVPELVNSRNEWQSTEQAEESEQSMPNTGSVAISISNSGPWNNQGNLDSVIERLSENGADSTSTNTEEVSTSTEDCKSPLRKTGMHEDVNGNTETATAVGKAAVAKTTSDSRSRKRSCSASVTSGNGSMTSSSIGQRCNSGSSSGAAITSPSPTSTAPSANESNTADSADKLKPNGRLDSVGSNPVSTSSTSSNNNNSGNANMNKAFGGPSGGSRHAKNKQFSKLLGGLRGSRDGSIDQGSIAPSTNSVGGSAGFTDDAFQASMGTKLRSHMQSSRRKIAKVFAGKILSRPGVNDPAPTRALKHKLVAAHPHPCLGETLSLEVVTHKDSVVVGDELAGDGSSRRSRHTPMGTPDDSLRSELSLFISPHRLRERWAVDAARFAGTALFDGRRALVAARRERCDKLLFELPQYFNARHIYPDDGMVQCMCSLTFRRDEIAEHQAFVHADVGSLVGSGRYYQRCPMAMFGCRYTRRAIGPAVSSWRLGVVKGALAVVPIPTSTSVGSDGATALQPHITTLPVAALTRIAQYLDPLSLSCLAETCGHLRRLVARCIHARGMVVPVWERSQDPDDEDEVRWTVARQRWTLSTFVQPVPLVHYGSGDAAAATGSREVPLSEHLRSCKLYRSDAANHGAQWMPLVGLTNLRDLQVTTDSDYESESEEEETGSEEEVAPHLEVTISVPPGSNPAVRVKSRLSILTKRGAGSQVRRKAKHQMSASLEEDEFQKALAVDELLGDVAEEMVDDADDDDDDM